MSDMDKRIAYVAMLDIVGFSKLPNELQVKKIFALETMIKKSQTFEKTDKSSLCVKTTGDGAILCFFDDMEAPLKIAIEIQRSIKDYNTNETEENKISIRIGLNIGQVSVRKDLAGNVDIIGNAVNKAERLMSFGLTNHILASREFHDLIAVEKDEYAKIFHYVGEFADKHGIKHATYNIFSDDIGNSQTPVSKSKDDEKEKEKKPTVNLNLKNPYQTKGKITVVQDFVGRQNEIRKIFSLISTSSKKNISIVGERKIGLSSLSYYITQKEVRNHYLNNPENYIFTYVECPFRTNFSLEEFFNILYQNIDKPFNTHTNGIPPTYDGFKRIISGIDRMKKCFVIVIDGIDNLAKNESFDIYFFDFLRFIDENYNIIEIVSSHQNLKSALQSKEYHEKPFTGNFETMSISHFNINETKDIIGKSMKLNGPSFEQHIPLIIDLGGSHPNLLQIACSIIFEEMKSGIAINPETIKQKFMNETKVLYQFYWDSFSPEEKSIIADLVEGRKSQRMDILAMKSLSEKGYVTDIEKTPKVFSNSFKEFVMKSALQKFQSLMSDWKNN